MAWAGPIFQQLLWNILRGIFNGFRAISWLFRGFYCRFRKNRRPDSYKGTVQCLKVITRFKFDLVLQPAGPDNFLLVHDSWKDPEVVLDDSITLYYITKTEAIFVQCPPDIDPANSDVASFVRIAQFRHATKIFIMPLHVFQKLGDSIRDPPGELVFMSNTARCGSTLICQIFEETKQGVSFSEPDALNAVNILQGLPSDEYDRAVKNIVKMLCKPIARHPDCSIWVLKMTTATMMFIEYFSRAFPNAHQIFMYRDGLPTIKSLDKAGHQMPLLDLLFFIGKVSPNMTKKVVEQMGFPSDHYGVKVASRLHFSTLVWGVALQLYREFHQKGVNIVGIRYEDLVDDPDNAVTEMFKHCRVPTELAHEAAKNGMSKDSQQNSPLSRDKLKVIAGEEMTPAIKARCDAVSAELSLPKVDEPCIMEGTIGHKGTDFTSITLEQDTKDTAAHKD